VYAHACSIQYPRPIRKQQDLAVNAQIEYATAHHTDAVVRLETKVNYTSSGLGIQ